MHKKISHFFTFRTLREYKQPWRMTWKIQAIYKEVYELKDQTRWRGTFPSHLDVCMACGGQMELVRRLLQIDCEKGVDAVHWDPH